MIKTIKKIYFFLIKSLYTPYIYHIYTYLCVIMSIYGAVYNDSNIYNVMIFHLKTGRYDIV